ncbi:P-loop containing nucleoside triphosphate hydrolase protein [Mycena metata]|uniref:DNA 3'-5' helicase n=1 Tax=Mycena metata TaxID=1033252 RepID=A0AAD7MLP1_9AGAR|nr:P-loop containing nucleoside triphosphate hydrolase protein [Mycena metata]
MSPPQLDNLLLSEIRDKVQAVFGYRPCLWQLKVVRAILKRDKDVASIAATGSGKTLTFWMPLLFIPDGIQIVVTPLNILGKQNVNSLAKVGISAVTITAETATAENFQAIADGKHRAIVTNIETLMKPGGGFEKLWNDKNFMAKVISVVWDEAQCISKWGDFRPEYKIAGTLRHLIPKDIPFYITSATLPPDVLHDVMSTLGMRESNTEIFTRSNDRSNVHITVRKMKYPMNSFKDLRFLIPKDWDGTTPLPYKFVIFFDSISESIAAAQYLRGLVPVEVRDKIKWFNSEMSPEFRAEESDRFNAGFNFGLSCTESFGMGIDLPNITLVIQWRASCDMCTLWQRFGRGARDPSCEAIALFLVEPMYFDQTKEEKAARKAKKDQAAASRKRKAANAPTSQTPAKRPRSDQSESGNVGPALRPSAPTTLADLRARFIASPPRRPLANQPLTANSAAGEPTTLPPNIESDSDSESDGDEAVALEERREVYRKDKAPVTSRKKPKKDGNELSPEMDDMINAGSDRRRHIKCYRVPARLYFGSDKTVSDHRECRPDLPDGCPRCAAQTPPICCELCTPAHFANFAHVDLPLKGQVAPSRSRLAEYKADALDMKLRDVLHQFRRDKTTTKFGRIVLKNSGPGMVMSNEVLQRIVDCAHFHKIRSTEQLARETRWASAGEFGAEVLALILEHRPPPVEAPPAPPVLVTVTPLGPSATNAETTGRSVRVRKCNKCRTPGHIASNRKCPFHPLNQPPDSPGESVQSTPSTSRNQNIPENITEIIAPPSVPRPQPRPLYGQFRLPQAPFLAPPLSASSANAFSSTGAVFNPITPLPQRIPLDVGFDPALSPETPSMGASAASSSSPFPSLPDLRSPLPAFQFYGE